MSGQKKGRELQGKLEATVRDRVTSIPFNQPAEAPISGYKTLNGERQDLAGVSAGARGAILKEANVSRVSALQGQQTLADFTTMLPEDFQFYLQRQLIDADGMVQGVGKRQIGSDHPFWEWASKKEALRLQEEYEIFKLSQVNLKTPESRAYWETRQPALTKKLRDGIRKSRAAQARIEDIGLYGVQDEKDLWLLYERERGWDRNPLGVIATMGGNAGAGPNGSIAQRTMGTNYNQDTMGAYKAPPGVLTGLGAQAGRILGMISSLPKFTEWGWDLNRMVGLA